MILKINDNYDKNDDSSPKKDQNAYSDIVFYNNPNPETSPLFHYIIF